LRYVEWNNNSEKVKAALGQGSALGRIRCRQAFHPDL
jgi:hypothetical protein